MSGHRRAAVTAAAAFLTAAALVFAGMVIFSGRQSRPTAPVPVVSGLTSPFTGELVSRLGPVLAVKIWSRPDGDRGPRSPPRRVSR